MSNQAGGDRASVPSPVRVGGVDKPALLQALRARRVQLNKAAEDLFADQRFTLAAAGQVIEIVSRSVADLGFRDGADYAQLVRRASAEGWTECPLELGPHLRLQFVDQADSADGLPLTHGRAPTGSITVASAPLDETDETPKGFYLRRVDGVLWLRGYWSWPGHVWSPEDVLVWRAGG
jgi:hypothetical protein